MSKMRTPEEAKKLHCCGGIGSHCSADKCMAWQWGEGRKTNQVDIHLEVITIKQGYCSLTSVKD